MTIFEHPVTRLDDHVARQLSNHAREAETAGDLHPRQLELMHKHKWLKMFVPPGYGGLGLSLPEAVRLEESLAWADGSTAWVATLCGGAGWFVGFVEPSVAEEFFTGNRMCIAGSGSATGKATIIGDRYMISGDWPFASGALHATAFTANCVIHRDGKPVLNSDGSPRVLAFILKREEVTVKPTWKAKGMVATASHSFSVTDVSVPASRSFEIKPKAASVDDPVYQFPFLQLAETTLAANISGMTVRYLELLSALCNTSPGNREDARAAIEGHSARESETWIGDRQAFNSQVIAMITPYQNILNDLRKHFFEVVDTSWSQLVNDGKVEATILQQISQISHALASGCQHATTTLNALLNLQVSVKGSDIDRVLRNIQTALTHALFRKGRN